MSAEPAPWAYVAIVASLLALIVLAAGIYVHVWRWRP